MYILTMMRIIRVMLYFPLFFLILEYELDNLVSIQIDRFKYVYYCLTNLISVLIIQRNVGKAICFYWFIYLRKALLCT